MHTTRESAVTEGGREPAAGTIILTPDLAQVVHARRFLTEVAAEAGFPEDRIFDINVACSEAVANAIEHAPVKGHVEVKASLHPDRLEVQVEGPGDFQTPDRLRERVTRGLGLPLMAKLSDHLALYSGPRGGTLVALTFYREGFGRSDAGSHLPPSLLALVESNERLEALLDAVQSAFAIVDAQGRWRYLNNVAAELSGRSKSDFLGRKVSEMRPDLVSSGFIAVLEAAKQRGETVRQEIHNTVRDAWFDVTAFPFRDGVAYFSLPITERKRAEAALRDSEEHVRRKLDSVLSPEGALGEVRLEDLIDTLSVQSFLDDFHELARVPLAIIDLDGNVLVGAGWSDICTRFHRAHPESSCHCVESDLELSAGVAEGEFKLYKCKNNMWDIATPMFVGGRHVGNIFSGQFFFEDETPDYELFRAQARSYGFDEQDYMAALDAVPRLSRNTVDATIHFFSKLARILSNESYGKVKLARALAERETLLESLRASEERFRAMFERHEAVMLLIDPESGLIVDANDAAAKFYGRTRGELRVTRIGDLNQLPAERVAEEYRRAASREETHFIFPHLAAGGQQRWVEVYSSPIELRGKRLLFSVIHDITERRQAERALLDSEEQYRRLAGETDRLYRQQLDIAENLQLALLHIPSEIGRIRLGHLYRSAAEAAWVGGDFYDVFEVKDDGVAILIGDVAGHGIPAARTATLVKDVVHAFLHRSLCTDEVLEQTNSLLIEKELPGFVTLFLGILDSESGRLRYSSAGHPEALLRRAGGEIVRLRSRSSPLGVFPAANWESHEISLAAEDILLLYTDGVTEARRGEEFFGERRLEGLLEREKVPVEHLPTAILEQVERFAGGALRDDIAVLALSFSKADA